MVRYLVFVLLLSWAMVDDFRKQEIADAVPAGLVAYAFMSGLSGEGLSLREACLGAFIGAGLMFILAVMSTMGGGDIKLMGALGAWFGVKVLDTFMLSFVVGLFLALYYYICYRDIKHLVPFGPAIVLASFMQMFGGVSMLRSISIWEMV